MLSAPEPAEAQQPASIELRKLSLFLERRSLTGGDQHTCLGQQLLCAISGSIPSASLFLVLGASGSGKSSLLNTLALRLPAVGYKTSGAVLYGGEPVRLFGSQST